MKSLYSYIVEKQYRPTLGSLAFMDLDDFVLDDLEQICNTYDIDLVINDKGPAGEGPYGVEIFPSSENWSDTGFVKQILKLGNELNPSGKMCNISFLNVDGFKYEAILNYLRGQGYKNIENYTDTDFQVFEVITSKDIKEFINILSNVNESKEEFEQEWNGLKRVPIFEFPSGDYVYVNWNKEEGTLEYGYTSNSGFKAEGSVDIDYSKDLDYNLDGLYQEVQDAHPEWLEEE